MAANVQSLVVGSSQELHHVMNQYVARGYNVTTQGFSNATLVKRKQFNMVWAVVGFFFCLIPLAIYLIVYATEKDQIVEITVNPLAPGATSGQLSPQSGLSPMGDSYEAKAGTQIPTMTQDRQWWWDGADWRDTHKEAPPLAPRSSDQRQWYDGVEWRPIPPPPDE
jgi:hypothetical protein